MKAPDIYFPRSDGAGSASVFGEDKPRRAATGSFATVPVRYLSKEWLAEARKRVDADKAFQEAAKSLTTSLLNVVTDAPGGKTIYLHYGFKDGRLVDAAVGPEAAIAKRPAEFKASATYETYALINQGKLGTAQAVFARKIRLEGKLGQALRYVKPLEAFNAVLRTVPTEY
jgi:putative sterol carrier protein